MIVVHHLENSRSQRILWLLEELGTPYEIVKYQRMSPIPLAPPELKQVHPLGKSPVITDGGRTIAESGAIVEYLVDTYGHRRLKPKPGSDDYWKYVEWMHYAEGSAMLPIMLKIYMSRLGDAGAPLAPRIASEIENHMGWLNAELDGRDWFVGNQLSAADIQLSFVIQATRLLYGLDHFPHLAGFLARIHARPAYKRSLERGGPYAF